MTFSRPAAVLVLAAGEGTRMRSSLPKVLHSVAGRSLLGHAMCAGLDLDPELICVVVRHQSALVAEEARRFSPDVVLAKQDEIPGTGRAVLCGLAALDDSVLARAAVHGVPDDPQSIKLRGPLVVISSDAPMLDAATLGELVAAHQAGGNAVTVLTTRLEDPTGYGRIIRDPDGSVSAIVEQRDASEEQRAITEINSSMYVFDADVLRDALGHLGRDNAQGEVYLTDVIGIARDRGLKIRALMTDDSFVVEGINDRVQLATIGREMNRRIVEQAMLNGVTIVDPDSTWIDSTVTLEQDVTLLPGTQLHGSTAVAEGAIIGPDTTLTDVRVGSEARIIRSHGSEAIISAGAVVGPFSYLRPGTSLGERGKIGAFVEVKNAEIGAGSKVPHLSYVGDAVIGEQTNIGAATIFVNYDGVNKFKTTVGSHVRIGADNQIVAPVVIGDGAYTGAGSLIRHDVPAGSLGLSSGPQRNDADWVLRRRAGTPAADAAAQALGRNIPAENHEQRSSEE